MESARADLLPKPVEIVHAEPIEVVTMRDALKLIAKKFKVDEIDIVGPMRTRKFNEPRSEFVGLCKTRLNKSYNQIGAFMSGRNHTSILNYYNMYRAAHPVCEMLEAA